MNPTEVDHGSLAPDGGKVPVIAIVEWHNLAALQTGFNKLPDIDPLLLCDWRHTGQRLSDGVDHQRRIANCEDFGMARHRQIGVDLNPTDAVAFGTDPLPCR